MKKIEFWQEIYEQVEQCLQSGPRLQGTHVLWETLETWTKAHPKKETEQDKTKRDNAGFLGTGVLKLRVCFPVINIGW